MSKRIQITNNSKTHLILLFTGFVGRIGRTCREIRRQNQFINGEYNRNTNNKRNKFNSICLKKINKPLEARDQTPTKVSKIKSIILIPPKYSIRNSNPNQNQENTENLNGDHGRNNFVCTNYRS